MIKELFGAIFGGGFAADFKTATVRETEAAVRNGNAQFVDVRSKSEYAGGHAENAVNVPIDELGQNLHKFDKEKPVYVICQSGVRSQRGATIFVGNGFAEVYNVEGGTSGWLSEGLPAKK
jgi:rhodanese-related sulfurtransferase